MSLINPNLEKKTKVLLENPGDLYRADAASEIKRYEDMYENINHISMITGITRPFQEYFCNEKEIYDSLYHPLHIGDWVIWVKVGRAGRGWELVPARVISFVKGKAKNPWKVRLCINKEGSTYTTDLFRVVKYDFGAAMVNFEGMLIELENKLNIKKK